MEFVIVNDKPSHTLPECSRSFPSSHPQYPSPQGEPVWVVLCGESSTLGNLVGGVVDIDVGFDGECVVMSVLVVNGGSGVDGLAVFVGVRG
jgi:hypothetical protein